MVKKTSFLDKLKNRWSSATGIRVDDSSNVAGDRSKSGATGKPAGANPVLSRAEVAPPSTETVTGRKLSAKQEAVVAINEGFKELASLLRGMQTRVDDQGEQIGSAVDSLGRLPALSEAQNDLMRLMIERLEKQNASTELLAERMGDMPSMVADMKKSLEQVAATDARTAKSLDEFKGNMGRIQDAMAQIVDHSGQQAKATTSVAREQTEAVQGMVEGMERNQRDALASLQETTAKTAAESDKRVEQMRKSQVDQSAKLASFTADARKSNKTIVVLLSCTVAALVIIAGILAFR